MDLTTLARRWAEGPGRRGGRGSPKTPLPQTYRGPLRRPARTGWTRARDDSAVGKVAAVHQVGVGRRHPPKERLSVAGLPP